MAASVYCGVLHVPQGSVLGPILFRSIGPHYPSLSLSAVIERHSMLHHSYADDSQLQNSATPDRLPDLIDSMRLCIDDIVTSAETERQQNRVHGAAIIALSTRARQPNLASFPTHTNINRHSQESGLFLRPPYATTPAGLELLFPSLLSSVQNCLLVRTFQPCNCIAKGKF